MNDIQPAKRLLDGAPYVNSAKTDIRKTFEKYGWTPPSERRNDERRLVANSATTGERTV